MSVQIVYSTNYLGIFIKIYLWDIFVYKLIKCTVLSTSYFNQKIAMLHTWTYCCTTHVHLLLHYTHTPIAALHTHIYCCTTHMHLLWHCIHCIYCCNTHIHLFLHFTRVAIMFITTTTHSNSPTIGTINIYIYVNWVFYKTISTKNCTMWASSPSCQLL